MPQYPRGQMLALPDLCNRVDAPLWQAMIELSEVQGHVIPGLSTSYAEGDNLLALTGSSGYLEIAVREASAAQRLRAGVGDEVLVAAVYTQSLT